MMFKKWSWLSETVEDKAEFTPKTESQRSKAKSENENEAVVEVEIIGENEDKEEKTPAETPKPHKKIDLEITNPNDIEMDGKGQLGLF